MNIQKQITVWDGVKIGCGIFIVLPCIILALFLLILGAPTCSFIKSVEGVKKHQKSKTDELQRKN